MMESVIVQARQLSSGTISTLTGLCRYDQIDVVRDSFVLYCQRNQKFRIWQDAWNAFWGVK